MTDFLSICDHSQAIFSQQPNRNANSFKPAFKAEFLLKIELNFKTMILVNGST